LAITPSRGPIGSCSTSFPSRGRHGAGRSFRTRPRNPPLTHALARKPRTDYGFQSPLLALPGSHIYPASHGFQEEKHRRTTSRWHPGSAAGDALRAGAGTRGNRPRAQRRSRGAFGAPTRSNAAEGTRTNGSPHQSTHIARTGAHRTAPSAFNGLPGRQADPEPDFLRPGLRGSHGGHFQGSDHHTRSRLCVFGPEGGTAGTPISGGTGTTARPAGSDGVSTVLHSRGAACAAAFKTWTHPLNPRDRYSCSMTSAV